jgi:hypothetical protein
MTYHIEQSKQAFDKIMDLSEFVKVIEDSYPILPDHKFNKINSNEYLKT